MAESSSSASATQPSQHSPSTKKTCKIKSCPCQKSTEQNLEMALHLLAHTSHTIQDLTGKLQENVSTDELKNSVIQELKEVMSVANALILTESTSTSTEKSKGKQKAKEVLTQPPKNNHALAKMETRRENQPQDPISTSTQPNHENCHAKLIQLHKCSESWRRLYHLSQACHFKCKKEKETIEMRETELHDELKGVIEDRDFWKDSYGVKEAEWKKDGEKKGGAMNKKRKLN